MQDPNKPSDGPAFPAFGVTREGEKLQADQRPAPPETPPVDPSRVQSVLDQTATSAPSAAATASVSGSGPIVLLDDDFFAGMAFADLLAAATQADIRTAVSEQKASALLAEETPRLVVVSASVHGASSLAAHLTAKAIPFAFLSDDGLGGAQAEAYPNTPVLRRGSGTAELSGLLAPLLGGLAP